MNNPQKLSLARNRLLIHMLHQLLIFTSLFVLTQSLLSCCKYDVVIRDPCKYQCSLVPDAGPCEAAIPRYYFDQTDKTCKQFLWGGCDGVVPFITLEECTKCACQE